MKKTFRIISARREFDTQHIALAESDKPICGSKIAEANEIPLLLGYLCGRCARAYTRLTKLAPDSLKAGVLSLPAVVKVEMPCLPKAGKANRWAAPLPARKKVNMARAYKSSSGRITQRRSGGQFRRTTLQDFGISQGELSDGNMICANCNYGEGAEKWRPVLKTGYCPKCNSQEKKSAQQSVHSDAGDSAASSELVHASAESTSQTVTQPTQRG